MIIINFCYLLSFPEVGLVEYLTQPGFLRTIQVGEQRILIARGVVDASFGIGEMNDNILVSLGTNGLTVRDVDTSASRARNKRPRVSSNEGLLGGGVQVMPGEFEVDDVVGGDKSRVPPNALTCYVSEPTNLQTSPLSLCVASSSESECHGSMMGGLSLGSSDIC